MDQTLYICSITRTGTTEWGKVKLDKAQQKSLLSIKLLLIPSGPPIIKEISLEEDTQLSKFNLNFSVLRLIPSLSNEIIKSPFLIFETSEALSFSTTLETL